MSTASLRCMVVFVAMYSLGLSKNWLDGMEKIIQSMQTHGLRKSPVSATQWALLGDTILPPVPGIHTCLATYDRLAASSKNHRGSDRRMLANAALECNR